MSRFGWGKAKSSYAARRVPTSANIFLITKAFSAKTDLPTSRVAFKRFPTKGFGAGGVALTLPVNLPCRPSSGHTKLVIRNRITNSRDGLHCPSASRKLPLETTHSWSEFVSSKHEKAWEVTREVTRDVWREVDIRQNQWYSMFYEYYGRCFTKNLSTHSRVKREEL